MRKKDEMELKISNKSVKISWFVTIITLFVVGFIEKINTGENNIFLVIAISSVLLNLGIERYYQSKMNENHSFLKFIVLVIILTSILLLIIWWSGS